MTVEVDPYEVIITEALADAGLSGQVGTRIDIWHHYGQDAGDWALTAKSLVLRPNGGKPDLNDEVYQPVIEARCYGDTPYDAAQVWRKLVDFTSGHNERRTVAVTEGTALLYFILPSTEPTLLFDEDVRPGGGMPFFVLDLQARVAWATVT